MIYPSRLVKILDELAFDFRDFTMEKFFTHVAQRMGREIHLIPWDMPPGTFGSWVSGPGAEFIVFAKRLPPLLRNHVQLHEIAHLLCGHTTITISNLNDLAQLVPLLRSGALDNRQEQEAEWLAALIQARVIRFNLMHELSVSISSDKDMVELLEGLGIA